MKIRITLNGGPDNPWHVMGLNANPFPRIPKAEFDVANRMLRELDSGPLDSTDDIRHILQGCEEEFIEGVCFRFKKGQRISFDVFWPD